jgi:hypothetical protein
MTYGPQRFSVAFQCAIASFPTTFLRLRGKDGRPSRLGVVFNNFGILVGGNDVSLTVPRLASYLTLTVPPFAVLELISKRGRGSSTGCDFQASSPSPSSDSSLQTTSPPPVRSDTQVQAKRIYIYVDVLPEPAPWPSPFPIVSFKEHGRSPLRIQFTSPPPEYDVSIDHSDSIGAQPSTSSLTPYATNPVVTFASPCNLQPHASFAVFLDGESSPVHSEVVPLICCASPLQGFEWLYSTTFVPGFWKTLRDCSG